MHQRARVLLQYCLWNAFIQLEWVRFAPLTEETAHQYRVGIDDVGLLSLMFPLLFIPLALPVGRWLGRISVHRALHSIALLALAATSVRLLVPGYSGLVISQLLSGLAQPIALGLLAPLIYVWFDEKERLLATSLGTMSIFVGLATALLLVPLGHHSIADSLKLDAVFAGLMTLCTWLWLPKDSRTCASETAQPWRSALVSLLQRGSVPPILCMIFIGNGAFNALLTWLEILLSPQGIAATEAGIVGLLMILGGVAGMMVLSQLQPSRRQIRTLFLSAVALSLPLTLLLLSATSLPVLCCAAFLLGFLSLAPLPLLLELIAEASGADLAGSAVSLFWLCGNAGSVTFMALFSGLLTGGHAADIVWLMLALMLVQGIIIWRWLSPAILPAVPGNASQPG